MNDLRHGETPLQAVERLKQRNKELDLMLDTSNELFEALAEDHEELKARSERLRKQNERLRRALREYGRAENWIPRINGVCAAKWTPGDRLGIPAWEDPTHIANLALGRQPG